MQNYLTDIRCLASLFDFDGLRQNLVLSTGVEEEGCALQRRIREGGYAQVLVLAFDDFRHRWQFGLGKVPGMAKSGILIVKQS